MSIASLSLWFLVPQILLSQTWFFFASLFPLPPLWLNDLRQYSGHRVQFSNMFSTLSTDIHGALGSNFSSWNEMSTDESKPNMLIPSDSLRTLPWNQPLYGILPATAVGSEPTHDHRLEGRNFISWLRDRLLFSSTPRSYHCEGSQPEAEARIMDKEGKGPSELVLLMTMLNFGIY